MQDHQGTSPNSQLLAGDVPGASGKGSGRLGGALSVSMATHGALFLLVFLAIARAPEVVQTLSEPLKAVIWLEQPGPGGGGGGSPDPAPIKKAELPKPKVTPTPAPRVDPPKEVPELPPITIAATSSIDSLPGALQGLPTASGTGGGGGSGTGVGGGRGSGVGEGWGGGTGGGAYRPGNGVISPTLIHEVRPSYTSDAMRAKIQGVVTMEAVVMPDGTIGTVQITRSLDPTFGLDQEAIRTVKKWRFRPGTRFGQPVPVLVEIEMTFTLR